MKRYCLNGYLGLVEQRKNRITGFKVGLYHGVQSGLEGDPETPWIVVCEEHSNCLSVTSLGIARSHMSVPEWCEDCRPLIKAAKNPK